MNITQSMFVPYSTVVLIGYADDGPANELIYAENRNIIDKVFGPGSQLASSVHEAYDAGARSVFAVRINGKQASVDIQGKFTITQKRCGGQYNSEHAMIKNSLASSIRIFTIGTFQYDLSQYTSVKSLVSQINYDLAVGKHTYAAELTLDSDIQDLTECDIQFSGGTDENDLSPLEIYDRLDSIYFMLLNYPVNIVVPLCAPLDTVMPKDKDFGWQLIDYCRSRFDDGEDVVGILPVKIQALNMAQGLSADMITSYRVNRYGNIGDVYDINGNLISSYNIDGDGNPITDGRFLSVVVSDTVYPSKAGYITNGAAAYAGVLSYSPFESTTHQTVQGVSDISYPYSSEQLEKLDRHVAFYKSIRHGICVYRGNTMYPQFNMATSKVLNHINTLLSTYLGDMSQSVPIGITTAQLQKKINTILQPLIDSREIRSIQATIDSIDYNSQYIKITLDFVRYGEVKHIMTQAGVYYRE